MPCIPRPTTPPARLALTGTMPEETAIRLTHDAECLDSPQESVIVEIVRLACRRDTECHVWLATTHPETRLTDREPVTRPADQRPTSVVAPPRPGPRGERSGS